MSATFFAGHDGLLCDLDGVVYAGGGAIAGAVETLSTLQERGVPVGFVTNNASRAIEDVLMRSGVPYRIVGGTRFYDRREIKDAIAYLRAVDNPDDDVNVRRILNEPKRGIGDRAEGAVVSRRRGGHEIGRAHV